MANKLFLLTAFLISSLSVLSQDDFNSVLRKGDDAMRKADFQGALKLYNAAETFPGSQKKIVDEKRRILFNKIESLYRESKKAKDSINVLFDEVTTQKTKADSALAKANRFIDALTFYADNFALAYKNGKVGFINKNGVPEIPYRYETAGAFDYTGLAKVTDIQEFVVPNSMSVKKEFRPVAYLIDTSDTQFKVAYQLDDLQEKEQIIEEEKIKAVDLRKTTLLNFPPGLKNHPQVEVLILDGELNKENNLKTITPELPFFTNLKYLSLRYCKLDSLPTDIGILDSLQSLDLEVNNIKQFPESFARLKELQTLNMTENELTGLPDDIGKLKKLKRLLLTDNRLSNLPASFSELTSLQVLSLRKNNLPVWPKGLENLIALSQLNYSANGLKSFPSELIKLKNLEILDLSFNEINSLPPGVNQLKQLKKLNMRSNNLAGLENISQQLTNLQWLDLSGNEFINFPSQILQLKDLNYLDLSFNKKLKSIPEKIKELKNLKTLILNNTDIPVIDREKIKSLLPACNIVFIQEAH